ncbi:MAG: hypothetical protein WBW81_15780 [Methylocella sp.]
MVDSIGIAGDVITGATALAGLILVYLGSVASSFAGFEREQQTTVKSTFQLRAWFGFAGMVVAIISAALALVGKWANNDCIVTLAGALLLIAFLWGAAIAFLTVREIR